MTTLFVRTQPKQRIDKFHRCGIAFGRDWKQVDVDAATAKRLAAEQMLEVTEERPEDMPEDAAQESAEQAGAEQAKTTRKAASK